MSDSFIREMTTADLAAVMDIEMRAYDFGWTSGIFRDCIRAGYTMPVLEEQGEVLAYGVSSAKAGECHILNLCVAQNSLRKGHGRILLRHMLSSGAEQQAQSAFLEVRPSNFSAIALYLDEGFVQIANRRDYYPARTGREDALVFAKELLGISLQTFHT